MNSGDFKDLSDYKSYLKDSPDFKNLESPLLDSSLITRTIPSNYYNCKIIKCGKYTQVYKKSFSTLKKNDGYELSNKENFDVDCLFKEDTEILKKPDEKIIEKRNLVRSKNEMCRLILSNEDKFETFITLTFEDDIFDLTVANKKFQSFIRKLKRAFSSELFYVSVPEFQKNGRVHYHMITNIDYNDIHVINENINTSRLYHNIQKKYNSYILKKDNHVKMCNLSFSHMNDFPVCYRYVNGCLENTKKTFNHKTMQLKIFKTIKFWNYGFSNVMKLSRLCDNVAGYMSKYMMKDIDNRLFGRRRYFYSLNLDRPEKFYLDTSTEFDLFQLEVLFDSSEIKFQNVYKDKFENKMEFFELIDKNNS